MTGFHVVSEQPTATSVTFKGLTPRDTYEVDVNAIGTADPSDWSNSAEQTMH